MAGSQIVTAITQIEGQRLGYNGITWDEWATALEPEITAGSKLEVGGALYTFAALEDIDSTAAWAGFANDTIVYAYIQTTGGGATCVGVLSTTAPSWSDAKQGYYNGSDRCYGLIYKDAGGTYTQKTIIMNREKGITDGGMCLMNSANEDKILRFASDAYIFWDESDNQIEFDNDVQLNGAVDITTDNAVSTDALNKTSITSGSQAIGATSTWVVPEGIYMFSDSAYGGFKLDVNSGGFKRSVNNYVGGAIISDGTNVRFYNPSGAPNTIYYIKFD